MTQNTEPDTLSSKQPVWTWVFFSVVNSQCAKKPHKSVHPTQLLMLNTPDHQVAVNCTPGTREERKCKVCFSMTVPCEIKLLAKFWQNDSCCMVRRQVLEKSCFFNVETATMWPEFEQQCDILHPKTLFSYEEKAKTCLKICVFDEYLSGL